MTHTNHEHEHQHTHNHGACSCGCGHDHIYSERESYKGTFIQLGIGAAFFVAGILLEGSASLASLICQVIAYFLLGRKVLLHAGKNIFKGHIFDENFLMSIATLAAFAIGDYKEAVAVMLFFQIGEICEEIAASRSRSQIMEAVDMRPEV